MAVAYDNDLETNSSLVGSLGVTFTLTGSDLALVAGVGYDNTTLSSVSGASATWSAVSGATATSGTRVTVQWKGAAPASGSQTVTATFANANGDTLGLGASSWTGAHQTTPASDGNGATGTGTTATVTVANASADDFCIDMVAGPVLSLGADQTFHGSFGAYGTSRQDGASGGVMSYSIDSAPWQIVACRVVPAAAGGATVKDLIAMGILPFARS